MQYSLKRLFGVIFVSAVILFCFGRYVQDNFPQSGAAAQCFLTPFYDLAYMARMKWPFAQPVEYHLNHNFLNLLILFIGAVVSGCLHFALISIIVGIFCYLFDIEIPDPNVKTPVQNVSPPTEV